MNPKITNQRDTRKSFVVFNYLQNLFSPEERPKTRDEDEIYKCVEFREILQSSLKLLARGKAIMTEIYDINSIELEAGADF